MQSNMDTLISQHKELSKAAELLRHELSTMIDRRAELEMAIELNYNAVKETNSPLELEMAHLDAEIERIMTAAGMDKVEGEHGHAQIDIKMRPKITDKEKFLQFILKYPLVLKADSFNSKELNKMVKDGIVPDPITDGIDINVPVKSFKFVREKS